MIQFRTSLAAVVAASVLAACGGGSGMSGAGSSSNPVLPASVPASTTGDAQGAIRTTNSLGAPIKEMADFEQDVSASSGSGVAASARVRALLSPQNLGVCTNGLILTSPDLKGTANTTEEQYFYSTTCQGLARDVVRSYNNANGTGNETVYRTVKLYNSAEKVEAIRTDTVSFTSGTFDSFGYPIGVDGYVRTSQGALGLPGVEYVNSGVEQVLLPAVSSNGQGGSGSGGTGMTGQFCSDSAGYNATGIAALDETFGWSGGVPTGGTRTLNSDGTITWAGTRVGTSQSGSIGSLYLSFGTPSTTCPLQATPLFTLGGGATIGSDNIPFTATFSSGALVGLTVTGATLASGDILNLSSLGSSYTNGVNNTSFITGTITGPKGHQIATLTLDQFGNGTLVLPSNTFTVTDWHVIK